MLKLEDNSWCRDLTELKTHINSYYHSLFATSGERNIQPVIDQCPEIAKEDMNAALMKRATMEEIKAAVFQLGATKAPRPDGLNGQFYQHHWEEVQLDVFHMVDSFLSSGNLDPSLNQIHIILIPKVANPKSITQFRPISLCNFSFKIISKVMANRLKPWLPDLIAVEQSAFVSGR